MMQTTSVVNGSGKNVPFGAELGRGGEGSVFEITSAKGFVAKIYHQALQPKKQEKILTMVSLKQQELLNFSTWPVDVIRNSKDEIIGFVMPRLAGKEIHMLYSPKSRLQEFPQATYPFLVHTAANLARAFAAVHACGHVIGDVNHGNFYVTEKGTVILVDCDSFQIQTNQDIFRCEVGIPMYQPPELQKIKSYRDVERTANHDNFGLAVFIFMILFMSRHPFAGVYSGPDDMPIDKAISQFRFAYSNSAAAKQMKPPPGAPPLNTVPPQVAQMFERAFALDATKSGGRPRAEEWIKVLGTLAESLKKCSAKEQHHYSNHLSSCPWCTIENQIGIQLFPAPQIRGSTIQSGMFRIDIVWADIAAVRGPITQIQKPSFTSVGISPSLQAKDLAKKRKRKKYISISSILAFDGPLFYFFPKASFWIVAISAIFVITAFQSNKPQSAIKDRYEKAKKQRDDLLNRWDKDTDAIAFVSKFGALESAKSEYQNLETHRNARLHELKSNQREIQFDRYLQSKRIIDARIDGIGPSRTSTLQSFGIETAADISYTAISQVPGFGPSFTQRLLDWKESIERQFAYNPIQPVSPADITSLDREIAAKRQQLEQQLLTGAAQLKQIADHIQLKRNRIQKEADAAVKEFSQAEADYNAV